MSIDHSDLKTYGLLNFTYYLFLKHEIIQSCQLSGKHAEADPVNLDLSMVLAGKALGFPAGLFQSPAESWQPQD